ncbi:MAG TPA: NUDIX domain-containing protein [Fimbriimonas sp.]
MSEIRRWTRVAGYALILRKSQILLCRLNRATSSPGSWTLPGGGIEFGEHPKAATIREVKEETGLTVRLGEVIDIDTDVFHVPEGQMQALRLIYLAESFEGELIHETDNSTDRCEWVDLNRTSKLRLVSLARRGVDLARSRLASNTGK